MDQKFEAYLTKSGKSYNSINEYEMRKKLFEVTDGKIEEWNSNPSNTHKLAHNFFSDMTAVESKVYRGYKGVKGHETKGTTKHLTTANLPDSVNWLEKGAVNPV